MFCVLIEHWRGGQAHVILGDAARLGRLCPDDNGAQGGAQLYRCPEVSMKLSALGDVPTLQAPSVGVVCGGDNEGRRWWDL